MLGEDGGLEPDYPYMLACVSCAVASSTYFTSVGPKQKGTQNRKQTAIYWSLLWGVCVLKILNTTTSLKNKEVGLLSICASLNIE